MPSLALQQTTQDQSTQNQQASQANNQGWNSNQAQADKLPNNQANQISGNPPLSLNSQGPQVKALQTRLNELGASLEVDGDFGPATLRAVRGFQNANRLKDDGVVGSKTAELLNGSPNRIGAKPDKDGKSKDDKKKNSDDPNQSDNKAVTPKDNPGGGTEQDAGPLKEGQLTSSFAASEFACHDGSKTPEKVLANLKVLAQQLEVLKEAAGGASITINSGYRSPRYNTSVGGAENSQHLYGRAADIVVAGMTPKQVTALIEKLIKEGKMMEGGLGRYSTFVHYDTRGSKARW
jgi:peptidoglycan hydrolase-like protein with peptidoglycan-binding domain